MCFDITEHCHYTQIDNDYCQRHAVTAAANVNNVSRNNSRHYHQSSESDYPDMIFPDRIYISHSTIRAGHRAETRGRKQ